MKKLKLILIGTLTPNAELTVKYSLALAVDGLEELPAGDAQEACEAVIAGLQAYKPGTTPDLKQWITDADNLANQIATDTGNATAIKDTAWVTQIAGYIAGGASGIGALIKSLFHKHVAPLQTITAAKQ